MGGNAIKNVSRIRQEYALSTMERVYETVLEPLQIATHHCGALGSIGKKAPGGTSGDIDIGVQTVSVKDTAVLVYNQIKSMGYDARLMKNTDMVFAALPIVDCSGNETGEFVQTDFMFVNDLDFAQWSYYSPDVGESKYKGLYRNVLNFSLAKYRHYTVIQTDMYGPIIWERYFINMNKGLFWGVQTNLSEKTLKRTNTIRYVKKEFVTSNPNVIVKMLYGHQYNAGDVLTFENAFSIINDTDVNFRNKVFSSCIKSLRKRKIDIPEELLRWEKTHEHSR